jgi:hypothetical protein
MDSCEHGNEPSSSIKCRELIQYLGDWWLLKKRSAPWIYSFIYIYTIFIKQRVTIGEVGLRGNICREELVGRRKER